MSLLIWIYRNILHPSERLFWNFWWSLISETLGSPLIGQLYGSSRFRIPSSTVISYFIFGESDSVEDLWQLHNSILNHDHIFQCLRVRFRAFQGFRQMQNSLIICQFWREILQGGWEFWHKVHDHIFDFWRVRFWERLGGLWTRAWRAPGRGHRGKRGPE